MACVAHGSRSCGKLAIRRRPEASWQIWWQKHGKSERSGHILGIQYYPIRDLHASTATRLNDGVPPLADREAVVLPPLWVDSTPSWHARLHPCDLSAIG